MTEPLTEQTIHERFVDMRRRVLAKESIPREELVEVVRNLRLVRGKATTSKKAATAKPAPVNLQDLFKKPEA